MIFSKENAKKIVNVFKKTVANVARSVNLPKVEVVVNSKPKTDQKMEADQPSPYAYLKPEVRSNGPKKQSSICRPLDQCSAFGKTYLNAYQFIEDLRAEILKSDKAHYLKSNVYMNSLICNRLIAEAHGLTEIGMDDRTIQSASYLLSNVNRLAAYSSWRVSKGIYRFDPDLYRELLITPFDGNLPTDVLTRISEYCLYVETPDMFLGDEVIHGFYYRLDFNEDVDCYIAGFLLDTDPNPRPISIQLGSWTLAEGLERNTKDIIENATGPLTVDPNLTHKFVMLVKPFLNLILYICSENAEIGDGKKTPGFPKMVKTKKGTKMFIPGGPTVWDVGLRIGAALRRAREVERRENGDPQRSVRPHIRRAHWHKYWIGSKKLKDGVARRFVHNWIPPIPVKVEDYDKLPAVLKPVR